MPMHLSRLPRLPNWMTCVHHSLRVPTVREYLTSGGARIGRINYRAVEYPSSSSFVPVGTSIHPSDPPACYCCGHSAVRMHHPHGRLAVSPISSRFALASGRSQHHHIHVVIGRWRPLVIHPLQWHQVMGNPAVPACQHHHTPNARKSWTIVCLHRDRDPPSLPHRLRGTNHFRIVLRILMLSLPDLSASILSCSCPSMKWGARRDASHTIWYLQRWRRGLHRLLQLNDQQ